jgi:uncharacterized C2H2 Zn-finger protein
LSSSEEGFVCPECGRTFSLERGLTRHRNYAHGAGPIKPHAKRAPAAKQRSKPAAKQASQTPEPASTEASLEASLELFAAPLRAEVEHLTDELAQLEARRDYITARLTPLKQALARLEPDAKPYGPGKGHSGGPRASGPAPRKARPRPGKRVNLTDANIAEVYDWIVHHQPELADGFTGASLNTAMKQNGGGMGHEKVRAVVKELHSQGRLRLLRKVRGGGNLYGLVGKPAEPKSESEARPEEPALATQPAAGGAEGDAETEA